MIYLLLDTDRSYKISTQPHDLEIIHLREGNEQQAKSLCQVIQGLIESGKIYDAKGIEHYFMFLGRPWKVIDEKYVEYDILETGRKIYLPRNVAETLQEV
jgi:hypothetical protein